MRIELDSVLPFRRETVFTAYRDDLPSFIAYMPNVRAIEVLSREEDGPIVRLHNLWHGATELPVSLAQPLEARFLSWDDHAVWDERDLTCTWTIEPRAFRSSVVCKGRCDFVDLGGDRARLDITGELAIELDRVRGMPSFLAGSLARTAESFLLRQVTANLEGVGHALDAYLREEATLG